MSNPYTLYYYPEAILPKKFIVCSIELKPFCLGHLLLLERIDSPLINSDVVNIDIKTGLLDYFKALTICSLSYEDGLAVLNDDNEAKDIISSIKEVIDADMEIEGEDWNIYTKVNQFRDYMTYFFNMPIYSIEQKQNQTPTGLDWKIGVWQIFKKMGYSETEILNMNLRRLFFEWCQNAETEGAIKVVNSSIRNKAQVNVINEPYVPSPE